MRENDYLIQLWFENLIVIISLMPTEMFSEEVWAELD